MIALFAWIMFVVTGTGVPKKKNKEDQTIRNTLLNMNESHHHIFRYFWTPDFFWVIVGTLILSHRPISSTKKCWNVWSTSDGSSTAHSLFRGGLVTGWTCFWFTSLKSTYIAMLKEILTGLSLWLSVLLPGIQRHFRWRHQHSQE